MTLSNDNASLPPARKRRGRGSALLIAAIALLAICGAAVAVYVATKPTLLKIAVGPADSDDDALVRALARAFTTDGARIRLSVVTSSGSQDSTALLNDGKVDLAVTRGDLDLPKDAQSLAILRKNLVVLWTTTGSRRRKATRGAAIKTVADLSGRRIGVLGRSSANVTLLNVILSESGVAPDKVKTVPFGLDQIEQMAHDDSIDAYMSFGPIDSKTTIKAIAETAAASGEPRFLPIDVSDAIAQKHSLYESDKIPKSSFAAKPSRPDDEIETVSVNHIVIAHRSLPDAVASDFLRHILSSRQALARELPQAGKIDKPDTDQDAALPVHPGAAAFIDGTERTFLEKYSDYLWASLFLMSGIGSLIAWFSHYAKHNERDLNARHRALLLGKIDEVGAITSLPRLTALRQEANALLTETLDCYEDGAIDAGDLAAFALILAQFNASVTERQVALLGAANEVSAD